MPKIRFVGDRRVKYTVKYYNNNTYLQVLDLDNNQCRGCGIKSHLIVHHKDGDRKNNKLDNMITLCKVCHAKIHGYTLTIKNPRISYILELRKQGLTYQEIGYQLGLSRQRVHQMVRKFPIDKENSKDQNVDSEDDY